VSQLTVAGPRPAWPGITATAADTGTAITGRATAAVKAPAIMNTDITRTVPERARALKEKETRDG
jgi:hypothetical protein